MRTIGACLLIVGVWAIAAVVFVGLGRAARRVIAGNCLRSTLGDFWTGLAVALSVAFAWHLLWPVEGAIWLVLLPLAVIGLALRPRPIRLRGLSSLGWVVAGLCIAVYVADQALQPMTNYDSGLYHLQTIHWTTEFPAIPGLGNFHPRLAYNSAALMLQSLMATAVPDTIAHHFSNGLLITAVCMEILVAVRSLASRCVANQSVPALLMVVASPGLLDAAHSPYEISSTSVDLPALSLTLVAASYACRAVTATCPDPAVLIPTGSLLALLPVVRVQLLLFSVVVGAVIIVGVMRHGVVLRGSRRLMAGTFGLMALAVGSWSVHGMILSGYPAFPATALGLPVAWRVPHALAVSEQGSVKAWARQPNAAPTPGFDWVHQWSVRLTNSSDVRGMAILMGLGVLLALLVLVAGRRIGDSPRSRFIGTALLSVGMIVLVVLVGGASRYPWIVLVAAATAAAATAVVLAVATIAVRHRELASTQLGTTALAIAGVCTGVAWFFLAPDPRFVGGVLWVTAALPAVAALSYLWDRQRATAVIWLGLTVMATGVYPVAHLAFEGMLSPAQATSGGTWGLPHAPVGETRMVRSRGLAFQVPEVGDQCWGVEMPCTPLPGLPWRLRSDGDPAGGFAMTGTATVP